MDRDKPVIFDSCASKTLVFEKILVTKDPRGKNLDTVDFETTLTCPKTVINGANISTSYRNERGSDYIFIALAEKIGKAANKSICVGCPFVSMTPKEAYAEARQVAEHRLAALRVTEAFLASSQPAPDLHNRDDLR